MEDRVSMGSDALEHIETLRRVAALASRLCLDVSGGLMTIRNGHSGSEWTKRLNAASDEIDRAMEHLVQVPSILSQDYAECDEDCAVGEDEGAGGKYASADAYEDAFHAAGGPDPSPSDAKDCNDVGWLDLSARFAALPGWASEAVVTTTCGDQPASFFPGGPYRYTYDDGVFKFYECDGGQVADHGVLDLRGTTRYPVNNLSVAEIVVAHWDFFKAGHGSLWDADCAAHIDPVERSKWTVAPEEKYYFYKHKGAADGRDDSDD